MLIFSIFLQLHVWDQQCRLLLGEGGGEGFFRQFNGRIGLGGQMKLVQHIYERSCIGHAALAYFHERLADRQFHRAHIRQLFCHLIDKGYRLSAITCFGSIVPNAVCQNGYAAIQPLPGGFFPISIAQPGQKVVQRFLTGRQLQRHDFSAAFGFGPAS